MSRPSATILDVDDGLARILGQRELYGKLLRRFRHDHHAAAGQIRRALDDGDAELAQRIAHTLRGAAGMIGASRVHDLAAGVETALRTRLPVAGASLDELHLGLAQLLCAVERTAAGLAAALPAPAPGAPADAAGLPLLRRLAHLLRDGDGAALDVLEHSAQALQAVLGVELHAGVAAAAQEFDFDGALGALQPALSHQ